MRESDRVRRSATMRPWLWVSGLLCMLPGVAGAAPTDALSAGDTAWMLSATALVLFMTLPGLALFYGGLVRTKNVLSVLMQCFAITCVVSLLWMIGLYSLSYVGGGPLIGGLSALMLDGVTRGALAGHVPESVFVMYQMTFAIITPALIVGAFAERMKFSAMLWFSALWSVLVYAPVCHWVWAPNGWLHRLGLLDFAGGTVVHVTAGIAALIAALQLGRRDGFPHTPMLPHNMTMTVTGAGMLWVGWFGFNAGSALAANGDAGMAMLVTQISAAAGALSWTVIEWLRYRKPSVLGVVTGMVAGLGSITPASGTVGPGGALLIGLVAGALCFEATALLKRRLHIDDSLDVFPVHGVGGILGTLATGILTSSSLGVFSGAGYAPGVGMGHQLAVQALGVLVTGAWSGLVSFGLLALLRRTTGLRVRRDDETVGLDTTQHNERAYDL